MNHGKVKIKIWSQPKRMWLLQASLADSWYSEQLCDFIFVNPEGDLEMGCVLQKTWKVKLQETTMLVYFK